MSTQTTYLEEITARIQAKYAEEYKRAGTLLATDTPKGMEALNTLNAKVAKESKDALDVKVKEAKEAADKEQGAKDAFRANALDVLGTAWKPLVATAEALTTVQKVVFTVERGETGKFGTPTVITPGKSGSTGSTGNGNKRDHSITIDGKNYPSVGQGFKAVMPANTPAPGKSATGRDAYSRAECVPIIEAAGHKVS